MKCHDLLINYNDKQNCSVFLLYRYTCISKKKKKKKKKNEDNIGWRGGSFEERVH